ncbi:MAG: CAP domain-containing protein [Anaerolineae bacterium]|nr:CAP domain-containing protein [Anaerolineae bacterium]
MHLSRPTLRILVLVVILASCKATPPTPATTSGAAMTPTLTMLILPTVTVAPMPPDGDLQATPGPTLPPDPNSAGTPAAALATHTVQPGDTLLGIAMQYQVPMAAIQLQNHKGDSITVRTGEQLQIPAPAAWVGSTPYWIIYQVNAGDTLSEIAKACDLSMAEIEAANGFSASDPIYAGQLLVLPLSNLAVARALDPTPLPATPTSAPTAAIAETTPTPTPVLTLPPATAPPADIAAWPYETVRIMNEVRASYDLPPLAYNETLAQAAQAHANDCAERGWCSHTGSDGSDIKQRILRVGYNPASWAECWAQRQTPQGAIDIWMDEIPPNDPHRRTLLTTWFTEVGIGIAKTSWGYYFIADFGKPR